jgi:ADP-ribose pyrophosphatase YjhB (NUDIX family)
MDEIHYLIVAGAIVEKDGKILLVQEGQPKAYGLWNTPAGRLDKGENALEGAKREVKEETGFDIEVNGLLGVYVGSSAVASNIIVCKIVFRSSIIGGELKFSKDEIMDVKWFKPSEVLAMKDSQLRGIRKEIEDFVAGKNYPIDVVKYRKVIDREK